MPDAVRIVSYLRQPYLFSGAVKTGRKRYEDQRAGVTCCVLMRRRDDANDSAASEALMIPHQPRGGTLASWRYGGESVLVVRRWFHRRPSITSTPLDRRGKRKKGGERKGVGVDRRTKCGDWQTVGPRHLLHTGSRHSRSKHKSPTHHPSARVQSSCMGCKALSVR